MDWKTISPSVEPISGSVRAFGVGHHAHHIAFAVEHAGDVAQRAVGVVDVAEGDAVFGFEFVERALVGDVAAFAVSDGQAQHLILLRRRRCRANWWWPTDRRSSRQMNLRPRLRISAPGSRPGFHQDLESVADAEHESAIGSELAGRPAITGENLAMAPQRR